MKFAAGDGGNEFLTCFEGKGNVPEINFHAGRGAERAFFSGGLSRGKTRRGVLTVFLQENGAPVSVLQRSREKISEISPAAMNSVSAPADSEKSEKTATPTPPAADTARPSAAPVPANVKAPGGIISTDGLVKVYGKREVVRDVSLHVRAGEIVGLLGPNGAGKTTTFYMVVGLVPATRGRVLLDGNDITAFPMWKRARCGLGYLPQDASIFRRLTVWENVMAVVETMPMRSSQRKAYCKAQLDDLGLMRLAKQPAYTLSGGERRRLEIARALATRPRFMLLDEPFSGVDPISVADVQKIVVELKHKGIGVLITDHNVRETLSIVDRAYLIHQGKVLVEGSSDVILHDEKARKFYLGAGFQM